MKKILIPILALLLSFGFTRSMAQTEPNKTTTTTTKKATKPMKKDGTPDMRYKENKDDAKPAPKHLKKDGTADKRYKENK